MSLLDDIKRLSTTHNQTEIAKELNTPLTTVRYHCKKHGIKTKRPVHERSYEKRARLLKLVKNVGYKEAAKSSGISVDALKSLVRRFKASTPNIDTDALWSERIRAINYASKAKKDNWLIDPEDFGSYVMLRRLEGSTGILKYLFTDFKREFIADTRTKSGHEESRAKLTARELVTTAFEEDRPDRVEIGSWDKYIVTAIDLVSKSNRLHRAVCILYFFYGLQQKELAFAFGVHFTVISLWIKDAVTQMRKKENPA
jgi:DNA-directed RNA polymerase specialized sigma24 family protein